MAIYAIGDINGCYPTLLKLLDKIRFDRETDTLWFTGNLVHPGTDSLATLRFVKELGRRAVIVLGNQEFRLLALAEGIDHASYTGDFDEVLDASDRKELLRWLRQRPLLHHEPALNFVLVHAGIPLEWSLSQAMTFSMEVESAMSFGDHKVLLDNLQGNSARRWHAKLRGWKRLQFIVNALTRMRYCNERGDVDFGSYGETSQQRDTYFPWYQFPQRATAAQNIVFTHWSYPEKKAYPGIYPLHGASADGGNLSALMLSPTQEMIYAD